ncbi:MAG TPA: histone deacetylase [Acidimicrobiia bacterium]|nr:histone deacetylase [Acidimicrobiia bacterium]
MKPFLFFHEDCLEHDAGRGHPERPERLTAARLGALAWGGEIEERPAPLAEIEDLYGVHDPAYVSAIRDFCESGGGSLDADTAAVADSWMAALRAAGAGLAALDAVDSGETDAAFLAIRPPGHHALSARAMGFCLFNNIAVAADRLRSRDERVAIVDWDVHHGNGTQEIFYGDADVLYISLHEFPFYPGTGWLDEAGHGAARGTTINVPVPARTAGDAYREAFDRVILPAIGEFAPSRILVSAGYDAHRDDPLAALMLEAEDYQWMAAALAGFGIPVVYFLEGGYDLPAIEASVAATLRGAAGVGAESGTGSPRRALQMIDLVAEAQSEYWKGVRAP